MEGIAEKARELGITIYIPSYDHDAALARWYKHLVDSGEYEMLFAEAFKPLSKFYQMFAPPTVTAFAVDDMGEIWATMWINPLDGYGSKTASVSAWTRGDRRGTPEAREAGGFCYSMAFEVWDLLISITRHEKLLHNLRQVGYHIVGNIPGFVDGNDGWVLYLTKENFKNSLRYGEK